MSEAGRPVSPEQEQVEADYDDEQLAEKRAKHQHSSEEKEALLHIDTKEDVIELNSLRIFSMDEIDLDALESCTWLEMRKNLIHKMIPLPRGMRDRLEVLDLFDNKLRHIGPYFSHCDSPAFAMSKLPITRPDLLSANGGNGCAFQRLRKLDLSYNQISAVAGLDDLAPTLEELYLVENKLRTIGGLSKLTQLRILELGGNQIRDASSGLETLVNLEELWLGKNKIHTLGSGFVTLRKLRRLSLQANRLTFVPPETFPAGANPELEELYLSENGLTAIENIRHLDRLVLLDYSFNPIASFYLPNSKAAGSEQAAAAPTQDAAEGAKASEESAPQSRQETELLPERFPQLEEFWLTDGKIESWQEVEAVFKPFAPSLRTMYLERNPIERDKRYRNKILLALPFVTQIDSWPVVNRDDPEKDRAIRR